MAQDAQQNRKIGVKSFQKDVVSFQHAAWDAGPKPTHRFGNEAAGIGKTAK